MAIYRVVIAYSGAIYFDVEANDGKEAVDIAMECFDDVDDRELAANIADVTVDEVYGIEEEDVI